MERLVRLLRPFVEPLLCLSFATPTLPEGTALVRTLKPSQAWLSFRLLATLFGGLSQTVAAVAGAVALVLELGPWGAVPAFLLLVLDLGGVALAVVAVRLDYEVRHYLVGDRSLRVSRGVWRREEATLSYANVQNVEVTQGPIGRIFGFRSVTVTTAGADSTPGDGSSLHQVTLEGLDDADEVRALIDGALRRSRDAGLGEPVRPPMAASAGSPDSALLALPARLLVEVRDAALAVRRAAERPHPVQAPTGSGSPQAG